MPHRKHTPFTLSGIWRHLSAPLRATFVILKGIVPSKMKSFTLPYVILNPFDFLLWNIKGHVRQNRWFIHHSLSLHLCLQWKWIVTAAEILPNISFGVSGKGGSHICLEWQFMSIYLYIKTELDWALTLAPCWWKRGNQLSFCILLKFW